ncbi:MAG: polynucleotide phosphorylase [Bacillota bacterium]|nr:polynucleotide phosphorylase [Bacillota bacterium]
MEKQYLEKIKELEYAHLGEQQEQKLREAERKFNEEFGTDYFFMVMKR